MAEDKTKTDPKADPEEEVEDDAEQADDQTDAEKGKGEGEEKRFTQAEVDEMIQKRLRRERRKGGQEKAKGDDDKAKGKDDDDASKGVDVEERINVRLRNAEARSVARDLKVKPDRIRSVIRLADLDGIDPDDTDAIEDAIEEVLEDHPEFKVTTRRLADRSGKPHDTEARAKVDDNVRGTDRLRAAYGKKK